MWLIRFHDGTLVVEGGDLEQLPPGFVMDDRIGHPRGAAWLYPATVTAARAFRTQMKHKNIHVSTI